MLATTLYLPPAVAKNVLLVGLGGNPIDVVRVLCLLEVGGPHLFGPAGATLVKMAGSTPVASFVGLLIVVAWIVVPVVLSIAIFRRQDL